MFWQRLNSQEYRPKWYLNGFPKAGLHILEQMVLTMAIPPDPAFTHKRHWVGTFQFNSFTNQEVGLEEVLRKMSRLLPGTFFKGHSGWFRELDEFLFYSGVSHVFVYRDLRDVAVSQMHHVLSDNDVLFSHPAKAAYRALGDYDKVLKAVIEGLGPFPGVIDRWEMFAPWLEAEWVHKVTFEQLMENREQCARDMFEYALHRTVDIWDMGLKADPEQFEKTAKDMAAASIKTNMSPTFRSGKTGSWREAFNQENIDLFKRLDNGWLVKLGYEEDDNWGEHVQSN